MPVPVPPPPPSIVAPAVLVQPAASPIGNAHTVNLPSELPSGDPAVDLIEFDYYPARNVSAGTSAPAVIVLPPIGSHAHSPLMRRLGQMAAAAGMNVAVLTLPYHGKRWPAAQGTKAHAALHFLSGDPDRNAQAFAQSASDVSTVVSWLVAQPGVDTAHIGFVGISLGAIVGHLAMGRDNRLSAAVAFMGAGDLPDISRRSLITKIVYLLHPAQRPTQDLTAAQIERILRRVDPLTYAGENRPRNVLMVQGARDVIIPPPDATELWNALGRPPIRWLDANHLALRLAPNAPFRAGLSYLKSVWSAPTPDAASAVPTPQLSVPTITLGLVYQNHHANSLGFAPALTYQLGAMGNRADHLPIAHFDAGITPRGPFAAAALTVNAFVDAGFASRLGPHSVETPRPYVGLHIAF